MMGFGMGFGVLGMIFMLVVGAALIVGAVVLVRALFPAIQSGSMNAASQESPREILDQRYARGEITRDEYEAIKEDLRP